MAESKGQRQPPTHDLNYYKSLGFACGLEIHQRLATGHKLFCSCDTNMSKEELVGAVKRRQRAVSGELGGIDTATAFEGTRDREFTYEIFEENTCLVELDEEPPHELNQQALETSLAIGKALNLKFFDELQPMRKGVVDGSDPSAFQRTILIGIDGSLPINGRKIGITLVSLEEESAGIKSNTSSEVTYTTERLGIPLIEIDTDATIGSASEAKEVALKIGTLLRLTGAVQRGIGSIRQDLNVSIKGGARVEVKGLQELDLMDRFVDMEIIRQQRLLEARDELVKRKAKVGKALEVTDLFRNTKVGVIAGQLAGKGSVFAFRLEGFAGLLGREINPGRRLGTEISDYARMAGVGGIIHSDEDLKKYGFSEDELARLWQRLGVLQAGLNDSFIIIAGPSHLVGHAAEVAADRARQALVGIPRETRAVHSVENCTTKFMRPIAGGSRMYPETDLRPVLITEDMLAIASRDAPDIKKETAQLVKQLGSEELAGRMIISTRLPLYKFLVQNGKADPALVANVLLQKFTELKRAGVDVDGIPRERVLEAFQSYAEGRITKQAIEELLKALPTGGKPIHQLIKELRLEKITGPALLKILKEEASRLKGADSAALVRQVMSKYRSNVDGQELTEAVKKIG